MKKKQYIIAAACLIVGLIGFGSVYATQKVQQKRQQQELQPQEIAKESTDPISSQKDSGQQEDKPQQEQQTQENTAPASSVVQPDPSKNTPDVKNEAELQPQIEQETIQNETPSDVADKEPEQAAEVADPDGEVAKEPLEQTMEEVAPAVEDVLHFDPDASLVWPLDGEVLRNYSMDATVYFPTLDQYKYNPATIIGGEVNSKVYLIARGVITDISINEETGCTVTQDLGDGYTAIYGQLKELNFSVGECGEAGQVLGYVNEPTKYYSVEGSNLYFELQKDGVPVDPIEYFQ